MHRDIKPGNIVFVKGILKLIDFGNCTRFDTLKKHEIGITTQAYSAPELLLRGDNTHITTNYGSEVDIWAAGVVLLELEIGSYPFKSDTTLLKTITSVLPVPDYGLWKVFSPNSDNILDDIEDILFLNKLGKMLCLDPSKREMISYW
jgi:serine/threonine protein kinase